MIEKIKKVNPFLVIFILFGIRYTAVGASIGDALVFLSLCSLFAVREYIIFKKGPDINADLKIQLEQIRTYVTAMSMKQGMKPEASQTYTPSPIPLKPNQRWF